MIKTSGDRGDMPNPRAGEKRVINRRHSDDVCDRKKRIDTWPLRESRHR